MKTKILTSVALASLMSLSFIACSSEPKSVEELSKLSKDELKKMYDDKNCEAKILNSAMVKESEKDKDDIECENIVKAQF